MDEDEKVIDAALKEAGYEPEEIRESGGPFGGDEDEVNAWIKAFDSTQSKDGGE